MANNQYVNKVEFGNQTIMDISSDTVTSDVLISGYTAHDRSGAAVTGSLSTFVPSGSTAAAGLVPAPSTTAGTTAFLCEDGTWKVPVGTTYSIMTGASASTAGTSGLVPAPSAGDEDKFLAGDGTYKAGGKPMVVLSYGTSTWDDFINAYNNNIIVYCKASSNSNPASGAQTRMAFMAYVNASPPTNVEFQYYRSVSSHSATQMGDQVFIYKLDKTNGWSVTTREASIKQISAGTTGNLTVSWSSNKVTIDGGLPIVTSLDNNKILQVVNGAWAITSLTIPTNTSDLINDSGFVTTDTTYSVFVGSGESAAAGLVPAPDTTAGTIKYLREDGTWAVPPNDNTTYTFTNKAATLAWNTDVTVATVGGVDITVKLPTNPNTDHYAWSDITGKPSSYTPASHTHSDYANKCSVSGYNGAYFQLGGANGKVLSLFSSNGTRIGYVQLI